jgi:maltose O-acetyltransferase
MSRSEREKMLAGEPYRASDLELVTARVLARRLTRSYNAADPGQADARRALLRTLFAAVGDGVDIEAPLHVDYGWNIHIGDGVYINAFAAILDCAPVTIGDGAQIGPGVTLTAATHPLDPEERAAGYELALPVVLGANVWLGAGVVVGPGVTIGDHTVVGAGSVVLGDLPSRVMAAGSPCRVVREL